MAAPKHDVDARVRAVLAAYERPEMTPDGVEAMRAAARDEFSRALRDRGTNPARFELVAYVDELVGPMAIVAEVGGKRRHWPLPAFQAWLSEN